MKKKPWQYQSAILVIVVSLFMSGCPDPGNGPGNGGNNGSGNGNTGTGTNPITPSQVGRFFLDSDNNPTTEVTDTTAFTYEDSAQKVLITSSDKAVGSSVNFILPDTNITVHINFAQDSPFPYGFSIVQDDKLVAVADISPYDYETEQFSMIIRLGKWYKLFEQLIFNKNVLTAYQNDPAISLSENIRNRNLLTAMALWSVIEEQFHDDAARSMARISWDDIKKVGNGIKAGWNAVVDAAEYVGEVLVDAGEAAVDLFVDGYNDVADAVKWVREEVIEPFTSVVDAATEAMIGSTGKDALDAVKVPGTIIGQITGIPINLTIDSVRWLASGIYLLNNPDFLAPQNVQAIAQSSNSVLIQWSSAHGATSYKIYRSDGIDLVNGLNRNTLSYTDTTVSPGTTYYYQVGAVAGIGDLTWSKSVSVTTPALPKVATPTASSVAGAVVSGTTITLSTTTAGATIYYTTNGSTPTTASTQYTSPISITAATTIKARAVKSGMTTSGVLTAAYTVIPATWGINLDVTGTHTFPAATLGYTAQTPKNITITNTGNQATGPLTAALSGTNSGSFTLSTTSISSVPVSGSATNAFTVVPNNGLAVGTYTATVTISGGNGITANFSVSFTVSPIAVTGVTLNKSSLSLIVGATETLTATVAPLNATNQNKTWSSSNGAIATVSTGGLVTAVAPGTAIITVTTADGSRTASATVTVPAPGTLGISIGFNFDAITITGSNGVNIISRGADTSKPTSLTLSATGYTSVQWYVDGVLKTGATGNSISLSATAYDIRNHSATFTGFKDGIPYSQLIPFVVVQ